MALLGSCDQRCMHEVCAIHGPGYSGLFVHEEISRLSDSVGVDGVVLTRYVCHHKLFAITQLHLLKLLVHNLTSFVTCVWMNTRNISIGRTTGVSF